MMAPVRKAPEPLTPLLLNLKIRTMALTNYAFGPNSRDITIIEHYHEAPTLELVLRRFITFSEARNQHIRTLLSQLAREDVPEKKQHIIAALSSIQSGHEQDLTLFKNLLDKP